MCVPRESQVRGFLGRCLKDSGPIVKGRLTHGDQLTLSIPPPNGYQWVLAVYPNLLNAGITVEDD